MKCQIRQGKKNPSGSPPCCSPNRTKGFLAWFNCRRQGLAAPSLAAGGALCGFPREHGSHARAVAAAGLEVASHSAEPPAPQLGMLSETGRSQFPAHSPKLKPKCCGREKDNLALHAQRAADLGHRVCTSVSMHGCKALLEALGAATRR